MLGQVAANMRAVRLPDPYKNKGVRYTGEPLRKANKVGKTGASATNAGKDQGNSCHVILLRTTSGCVSTSASALLA